MHPNENTTPTTLPKRILPDYAPTELKRAEAKVLRRDARAQRGDGYGSTLAGKAMSSRFITALADQIAVKLRAGSDRNSDDAQLEFVIRNLKPETIALATLQAALHTIGGSAPLRETYLTIGRLIERECFTARLLQHDRKRAEKLIRAAKETAGSAARRMAKLRKDAAKAGTTKDRKTGAVTGYYSGFQVDQWDKGQLIKAGAWCVSRLREALPTLFKIVPYRDIKPRTMRVAGEAYENPDMLVLTDEGVAIADKIVRDAILNNPVYAPMTTRPRDWDGYTARPSDDARVLNDVTLVRTRHKDVRAAIVHAIKTGQAAPALKGLNLLQSVPYKVNTWILSVIEECYALGLAVEGLPALLPLDYERLSEADYQRLPIEKRELYSRETKAAKRLNLARIGETVSYNEDMRTAREMANQPAFYTPMNFDWRTRVYGVPFFNFQREDRVRALFLFARGLPMTDRGLYWLKVHVANCGAFKDDAKIGLDKKPLSDRVAWVDGHLDAIRQAIAAPTAPANQWWINADSPFLFLAACRELVQALDAKAAGVEFITHMPCSRDGSCSGIQHLSCMTRADEGRLVNLTNNAVPEDIYQRVAEAMRPIVLADIERDMEDLMGEAFDKAEKSRRYATMALPFIDRKLVKRNTMTFSYSSKEYGMADQHLKDTMIPMQVEVLKGLRSEHPFGDESTQFGAAKYLGRTAYRTICSIVKKPAEAMAFLQKLAQALAHEGKPLRWTTPCGMPWINRYHDDITEQVNLTLNDNGIKTRQRITVAVADDPAISKSTVVSAVAPNFVHALDSSHLLLTVVACAAEGIVDIATVHDSFGCLAPQCDQFDVIIRATMVQMYTKHDVLAEVFASAKADLTQANHDRLPAALPRYGHLNLEEIHHAKYAFC